MIKTRGPSVPDSQTRPQPALPVEELRLLTHVNASKLYRHPLPEVTLP